MYIYLPIAEVPINVLLILGMGLAVGFLSGMFGIGGGFLLTPLLIFTGVPPAVAVATQTGQIAAASFSGMLAYWRRRAIDMRLALVLLAGGLLGTTVSVWLFALLRRMGQLDLVIALGYVFFLGVVGAIMLAESVRAITRARSGKPPMLRKPGQHIWLHRLPLKMRFPQSRIYLSAVSGVLLGAVIGLLGAILGIGGGFMLVPALVYLLRVPAALVVGTSLFQIVFTMAAACVLHAVVNQSIDLVLAVLLMAGSVVGAQFGAQAGQKLRAEYLRALLGVLVLAVGARFALTLVTPPPDPYSLTVERGPH